MNKQKTAKVVFVLLTHFKQSSREKIEIELFIFCVCGSCCKHAL